MFDENALFSDAQSVTTDAYSTNALKVDKTPVGGVTIAVAVGTFVTLTALNIYVLAKDGDGSWDYTDETQRVASREVLDADDPKIVHIKVQTNKTHLKLYYNGAGTPGSIPVTAGIVPGLMTRDAGA